MPRPPVRRPKDKAKAKEKPVRGRAVISPGTALHGSWTGAFPKVGLSFQLQLLSELPTIFDTMKAFSIVVVCMCSIGIYKHNIDELWGSGTHLEILTCS